VQPIAGRHDAAGGVAPAPWNYATRLPGRPPQVSEVAADPCVSGLDQTGPM